MAGQRLGPCPTLQQLHLCLQMRRTPRYESLLLSDDIDDHHIQKQHHQPQYQHQYQHQHQHQNMHHQHQQHLLIAGISVSFKTLFSIHLEFIFTLSCRYATVQVCICILYLFFSTLIFCIFERRVMQYTCCTCNCNICFSSLVNLFQLQH